MNSVVNTSNNVTIMRRLPFLGKKISTQHNISRSSFPSQFCVRRNFSLQGCGLCIKLIQAMLTTCLAQQYMVKCVLINKKTLSGLARILLAL